MALRLVVFAARRTGSSLLVDILRGHPQILMHGEVFHVRESNDPEDGFVGNIGQGSQTFEDIFELRRRDPWRLLHHLQSYNNGRRVVGLKVFRDHVKTRDWPVPTHWCTTCIILQRVDVRRQYHSLIAARRTGKWKGKTSVSAASDTLNATLGAGFDTWRQNQEQWFDTVSRQLARRVDNATVVHLTYEHNLAGPRGPELSLLWRALDTHPITSHQTVNRRSGARL
jgi:hypothetical protein